MAEFVTSLVTALLLVGGLIPWLRTHVVDVPSARSSHTVPIPRGGGLGVVAAIVGVASLSVDLSVSVVSLLVASVATAGLGFVDDVRPLSSRVRLLAQFAAAIALVVLLLAEGKTSWWWLPTLVVGVAGFVNAFNFMDGVNGISGLTAAVIGFWWAWAGHVEGNAALADLGLVLAGASIGFLPWNIPRALVFLGDVGSYGLGIFIVGLSALAVTAGVSWWWALTPLVVYGADTGWILIKRASAGRSLAEAHRDHVYQRLVDCGWPHLASAMLCAGATGLVCVAAGAAGSSPVWWAAIAAGVVVMAYLGSARAVEAFSRRTS